MWDGQDLKTEKQKNLKIFDAWLKRYFTRNNLLFALLLVFVFFFSTVGTYFVLSASKMFVKNPLISKPVSFPVGSSKDPNAAFGVLLLGYGGAGHDGGGLSDVLIVVLVEPKEKRATLISVPRDLWVEIPVRSDQKLGAKINEAYAIGVDETKYPLKEPQYMSEAGGGNLAKFVISEVVGFPVDYFISVDFESFKSIAGHLGGIEIEIPKTFDDYFYPVKGLENETCGKTPEEIAEFHAKYTGFELEKQFECRYEHIHYDAGVATIDGESALKFVRSRHSNEHGGDFARSERQYAVLEGIRKKLSVKLDKWGEVFDELTRLVKTDLDKDFLRVLIQNTADFSDYKIVKIHLTEENVLRNARSETGQFILLPKSGQNWDTIRKYIQDQIGV